MGHPSDVTGRNWSQERRCDFRPPPYQRKLAVAEFDGICSAHAMVIAKTQDDSAEFAVLPNPTCSWSGH